MQMRFPHHHHDAHQGRRTALYHRLCANVVWLWMYKKKHNISIAAFLWTVCSSFMRCEWMNVVQNVPHSWRTITYCNTCPTTDLGSLIGNTQCGNFRIFLLLRNYVHRINFGHFEAPKTAVLTILAALNFEFLDIFDIFNCEIPKNLNSKLPKNGNFWPSEISWN